MMLGLQTILKVRKDARYRLLGHETVAIKQEDNEVLVLDEVGGRVLELVDGQRSLASIVDLLLQEYDVGRDRLESDVRRFAQELVAIGLVVETEP